ncbi:tripartite tricarboxylate transporter TctB family protein [Pseudothermotoga sp.]|jgi:putative tricarboxylic transport membrane protein|uniref:tripartite tricarboxylate transporter TctB family protein n=1 Tax=Pseudothermotoga sp. TaxID=2033661 RepID=UPI002588D7DC|nr:tripartite tricarboxylate transporter TctB family protein [Pseudothermotoga sp.]MDK2885129.1 putative tricarboxylic transport rane protein [Pseudothermotoga sp.]
MKQSSEKILAIVVLSFGVMYIITTLGLPRAPVGNPMSPLYFPIGLGILMSVLGFLMLIRTEGSKVRKEVPKRSYFYDTYDSMCLLCLCYVVQNNWVCGINNAVFGGFVVFTQRV